MKLKHLTAALALAAALGPAAAADLLNIYRDALVSDPVYQAARAQRKATIERLPQARAGYLPFISRAAPRCSATTTSATAPHDLDYTDARRPRSRSRSRSSACRTGSRSRQAEKLVLQADARLADANQDLILRAAQAYFDVLLAQDNVALSEAQKNAFYAAARAGQAQLRGRHRHHRRHARGPGALRPDGRQGDRRQERPRGEAPRAAAAAWASSLDGLVPLRSRCRSCRPQPNDIEAWVKRGAGIEPRGHRARKACAEIARAGSRPRARRPPAHARPLGELQRATATRSTLGQLATGVSPTSNDGPGGHRARRADLRGRPHAVARARSGGAARPRRPGPREHAAHRRAVGAPELPLRDQRHRAACRRSSRRSSRRRASSTPPSSAATSACAPAWTC